MTREQITAMLDGLDGVTPGPWKWEGSLYERMAASIRSLSQDRGLAQLWEHKNAVLDAAHIARCDPDTIRALCELALEGLEAKQEVARLNRYAWLKPDAYEKAAAERDALRAENERLLEGFAAAIRAAELAIFVIRKQGIMPNDSWKAGFEKDMATAKAALERKPE